MSGNSLTLVLLKTQIKNIRQLAKVNIKSDKITPFGGIFYASKAFYALPLDKVINGTLGVHSSTYNGYQWDEIMSAMSSVFTSLSPTSRVKKFVFHFTAVCAKWTRTASNWVLPRLSMAQHRKPYQNLLSSPKWAIRPSRLQ